VGGGICATTAVFGIPLSFLTVLGCFDKVRRLSSLPISTYPSKGSRSGISIPLVFVDGFG